MSISDQFKMGKLPIIPASLSDKDLASPRELLIDNVGTKPTYHIYVVDSEDRTRLIDITQLIINEILSPSINADNMQVTIEDSSINSSTLKDVLNYIYSKFIFPENEAGYNAELDKDKFITDGILNDNVKSVLLTNSNGSILMPVTTADNIYDTSGVSIQDRLNKMTRIGFSTTSVTCENLDGDSYFEFEFPFPNYLDYGDYIEVRLGSVIIDKERYQISPLNPDLNGDYYKGFITFTKGEIVEYGRSLNILFIYNSASPDSSSSIQYMSGATIANASIPITKFYKSSDMYDLNDSTSVATSKALYNLYREICTKLDSDNVPTVPTGDISRKVMLEVDTSKIIYTTVDNETTLSYGSLNTTANSIIEVYRNGVRIFENYDYTINTSKKTITIFVKTEANEKFVFISNTIYTNKLYFDELENARLSVSGATYDSVGEAIRAQINDLQNQINELKNR